MCQDSFESPFSCHDKLDRGVDHAVSYLAIFITEPRGRSVGLCVISHHLEQKDKPRLIVLLHHSSYDP
jgi:hypothetical protein